MSSPPGTTSSGSSGASTSPHVSSSSATTTTTDNAATIVQKIAQDLLELQKTYAHSFRKCNSNLAMHKRFSKKNQHKLETSLSTSTSPSKPVFSPSSSCSPSSPPLPPPKSSASGKSTLPRSKTSTAAASLGASAPTSSAESSDAYVINATAYFSPMEEAILRANSFPVLINETAQVSVFGEKGKL